MSFTTFGMVYIPAFKLLHHLFHKRKKSNALKWTTKENLIISVSVSAV